jgi:hypothetical protein
LKAGGDFDYFASVMDNPFGEKKASRQFPIATRCAHGDGDAPAPNADFQWFLPGQPFSFWLKSLPRLTMNSFHRRSLSRVSIG